MVVEDSVLMRKVISDSIKSMDGVEVVGTAQNGHFALAKLPRLKPDLVTLDIEMPVMNGLETIEKIREISSVPIIMLSASDDKQTTIHALEIGAQDFITKAENIMENRQVFTDDLEARIKALVDRPKKETAKGSQRPATARPTKIDALLIGASTGGPKEITRVIKELPANLSIPVFIVQHMPAGFTASFAERLNALSKVPVVEAEDRMLIKAGTVYLAPGGKHMIIDRNRIVLTETEKIHSVRPAVDPLFRSAVDRYGRDVLGVILTGMGRDGTQGCKDIKKAGGYVIAQDEETCVVYGMPRYAHESGAVDELLPTDEILKMINQIVRA